MQTQTSNTLHNAIMEAGSKDPPPMLTPEIRDQLNAEAEAVQIILTGIDNVIYSIVDACPNACEMWKVIERTQQAATRNRGKEIVKSPQPIYDQEPSMADDDEMSKDKEIDKLMALISLSNAGYEHQRLGNVAGARETVGSTVVQKSGIQCYNCKEYGHVARECQKPKRAKDATYHREKMLLCKQDEAGIQLNAEQADWKDDTDDESDDQELEAHYMYMAKLQQVSPDDVDSGPIFDKEPEQKVQTDDHYDVFAIECQHPEQSESAHKTYLIEQDAHYFSNEIDRLSREYYYADHMNAILDVYTELDEVTNLQCDYLELLQKCKCLETELSKSKMMSKSFESVQKHTINLELELQQCKEKIKNDMSFKVDKSKDFCKEREQYFEIQDLKAQLQDKGIVITPDSDEVIRLEKESRLKLSDLIRPFDYDKLNNLYDLFVPQRKKSSEQRYFSERSRLSHTNVNNGKSKESFNKQTTLLEKRLDESTPLNKNKTQFLNEIDRLSREHYYADHMNAILGVYTKLDEVTNLHCDYLELLETCEGVIMTSVSRPQLKSNPMGDTVMRNNSQGKKQEVEDQRRNVKLSKNKTSVTACHDSLNAKTLNVNFV
nr:hypothetical protein [Tanacetum cinerariifolium]